MKYSILGYSQRRLLELNLGMDEAQLLRWFVEYQATGKMRSMLIDGREYTWVNFSGVLEDVPILGGSPKTINRRFDKLEAAGVMEHRTVREGGIYSYYRIVDDVYMSLIDDLQKPSNKEFFEGSKQASDQEKELIDHETDLSNGKTVLSNHETKVSEQMTHTQDTYTRNIKSPLTPTGEPTQDLDHSRKSKKQDPTIPEKIRGDYRKALEDFIAARRETRYPMTQRALDLAVADLDKLESDEQRAACVRQSIIAGYRGIFTDRVRPRSPSRIQGIAEGTSQRTLGNNDSWEAEIRRIKEAGKL